MNIKTSTLLQAIWTGEAKAVPPTAKPALIDTLETLFKIQTVVIEVPAGPLCGQVLQETTELMPDLPVADVLDEELDIHVPDGAVIVCLSRRVLGATRSVKDQAQALGNVCAQIVVDTVQLSAIPFANERQEMRQLAQMVLSVALHLEVTTGTIETALFRSALARGLAYCLEGPSAANEPLAELEARYLPDPLVSPAPEAVLRSLASITATLKGHLVFPNVGPAGSFAKLPTTTRKV